MNRSLHGVQFQYNVIPCTLGNKEVVRHSMIEIGETRLPF